MDSRLSQVDALLTEGQSFTFENFSDKEPDDAFGRSDTPEWHTWHRRSYNLVKEATKPHSAASSLASELNGTTTEGNEQGSFEHAKRPMLEALRLTKTAMEEDVYGELADECPHQLVQRVEAKLPK